MTAFFKRRAVIVLVSAAVGLGVGMMLRTAPRGEPRAAPAAALALQSWVVTPHQVHPAANGRIALATASRFHLRVRSASAGTLSIYVIRRDGGQAAQPLWQAPILAGTMVDTPAFTMQGALGSDTMRVVLAPNHGAAEQVQEVAMWHYPVTQ